MAKGGATCAPGPAFWANLSLAYGAYSDARGARMHTAWPHSKPTVASEFDVVVALERAHSVAFGHVAQILRVRGVITPRRLGGRG